MLRYLLRWFAPLLLAGTCFLPVVRAQPAMPVLVALEDDPLTQDPTVQRVPAFQYFVAILSIIIVMMMMCKPTRKLTPSERRKD